MNPLRTLAACLLMVSCMVHAETPLVIAADAKAERLADGFLFTEGPTSDAHGNVYFTDQPNDRIMKWSTGGTLSTFLQPCGRANGMFFSTRRGTILACADEHNELWEIDTLGKHTVLVKDFQGKLLNGPNDAWESPNGGIYFTDPYYKRPYWQRDSIEQSGQHVYYLALGGSRLIQVTTDLQQPNGVIGTPDGKRLYVADIGANKTWRYSIKRDGSLTGKTLFCTMGSDGMTMDSKENIFLTGDGVTVFNRAGQKIGHIKVDEPWTANICFGGSEHRTLFITASKGIYCFTWPIAGAYPHGGK
jgi:gluconolactonase